MDPMKWLYHLLICQGFYLGSVCQRWTFPSRITALIGSCVEIPCAYYDSVKSNTAWYLYSRKSYPEILNTKDSTSVMMEYKDRTSLMPGDNSCTLRIDPVKVEDCYKYYYPGIPEYKAGNAYSEYAQTLYLDVTDREKSFIFASENANEGEATVLRCTAEHTCRSSPPSIQWNKPGHIESKSEEVTSGYWLKESKLTYVPSNEDDGIIKCTATYPNGKSFESSRILNIIYAPKNVTVTVITVEMGEVIEGSDVTLKCNCYSKIKVDKYEWYKGKDKIKLPYTGSKIGVRNVTRDTEPYSCVAINAVDRVESALMKIPVRYKSSNTSSVVLPATIGTICLLLVLLALIACFYWRKRCQNLTSSEPGNSTRTTITEGHTETSPNHIYTDLVKSDITSVYNQLKLEKSTHIIVKGRYLGAAYQYENVK
ncbi:myelin-associated glycoprotein-like [Ranitomeya variabilis]|uniref:myelin-associated glycoprotein-like n=1 Tax=Ranitomeya variabilis TaxID=490064 RepID=UPI004056C37B